MCFVTNSEAKIAKKDIQCVKVIRKNNSPAYRWAHNITTPYKKGEKNPEVEINVNLGLIFEGYHSTKISDKRSNKELKDEVLMMGGCEITLKDLKLAKFIIPKGTRYFENDTEYVSETIIML